MLLVGALVAVAVLMAALAGPWQLERRSLPDAGTTPAVVDVPPPTQEPSPTSTENPREQMPISQERWIYLVILTLSAWRGC